MRPRIDRPRCANYARRSTSCWWFGARNSSNSNQLREIGAQLGVPSYLVADSRELEREWVADARVVGVTAGASAPEHLVEGVVAWLEALGPIEISTLDGRDETIEFRLPAQLARV